MTMQCVYGVGYGAATPPRIQLQLQGEVCHSERSEESP